MNKVIQKLKSLNWAKFISLDYVAPAIIFVMIVYGVSIAIIHHTYHDVCIKNGYPTSSITPDGEVICEIATKVKASTLPGYKD